VANSERRARTLRWRNHGRPPADHTTVVSAGRAKTIQLTTTHIDRRMNTKLVGSMDAMTRARLRVVRWNTPLADTPMGLGYQ
jgi:hypothetical protein